MIGDFPPVDRTGWIEETCRELPFGACSYTRRLSGPGPYYLAEVRGERSPGDVVTIGPWRFRYVDYSIRNLADVLLLDTPPNRLRHGWYLCMRRLRDVLSRVVLTLYVWGLADFQRYAEPSLRDVPALRPLLDARSSPHPWWPEGHAWQTA